MNVFHHVALQSLKRSPARTLVTIVGIALAAALMTVVAAFGTSLLHFLVISAEDKYGDWHVSFDAVDTAFVQAQAQDPQVAHTAVLENLGYATLEGVQSPEKPYLFLAGLPAASWDTLPIRLLSGRLPENDGEVLVPSHLAVKGGVSLSVGDTLTLSVGSRQAGGISLSQADPYRPGEETLVSTAEKTYTVVGTCERPTLESHDAPGYTLLTTAAPPGQATSLRLFVTLYHPRQAQDYAAHTGYSGQALYNEPVLRFLGASESPVFQTLLVSVCGSLLAIVMVGAFFLIYNSFQISLSKRMQQFGLLASVGATEKQLRSSVRFEGLCLSAVGIPLGILAGIGGTGLLLPVVSQKFSAILHSSAPLTLSLSLPALAAAAAICLATVLFSAALPARKALSKPIMVWLRQTEEIKEDAKALNAAPLLQRLYGLEGMLAHKNFRRNRKRYRSVVLSLTLSIVLFVAGTTFSTTLKRLADQYTVDFDYDLCLSTQAIPEDDLHTLYPRLSAAAGVTESSYQAVSTFSCPVAGKDLSAAYRAAAGTAQEETLPLTLEVQFIEDSLYHTFLAQLTPAQAEQMTQQDSMLVVAKGKFQSTGTIDLFSASTLPLSLSTASGSRTIQAVFVDTYPEDPLPTQTAQSASYVLLAVAPYQQKAQFDLLDAPTSLGLTFRSATPAQTVSELEAILQEAGFAGQYTMYNLYEAAAQFQDATFVVDVFTYIFVLLLFLIAAANVFNTISTNIKLRRRELAMLRSVGMAEGEFHRMLRFECLFYGGRTLLFGLPLATLFAWLIQRVLASSEQLEHFPFLFPWASLLLSAAGVFALVFLTTWYAARQLKQENILDALRDEMT